MRCTEESERRRGQVITESVMTAPTWSILYMSGSYEESKSDLYSHADTDLSGQEADEF